MCAASSRAQSWRERAGAVGLVPDGCVGRCHELADRRRLRGSAQAGRYRGLPLGEESRQQGPGACRVVRDRYAAAMLIGQCRRLLLGRWHRGRARRGRGEEMVRQDLLCRIDAAKVPTRRLAGQQARDATPDRAQEAERGAPRQEGVTARGQGRRLRRELASSVLSRPCCGVCTPSIAARAHADCAVVLCAPILSSEPGRPLAPRGPRFRSPCVARRVSERQACAARSSAHHRAPRSSAANQRTRSIEARRRTDIALALPHSPAALTSSPGSPRRPVEQAATATRSLGPYELLRGEEGEGPARARARAARGRAQARPEPQWLRLAEEGALGRSCVAI